MKKYRITGYTMSDGKFDAIIEAQDRHAAIEKAQEQGLDTWSRYDVQILQEPQKANG